MWRLFYPACAAMPIFLMCHSMVAQDEAKPTSIRVLSFNIRYDNPRDGDNAWPKRRDKVAEVIQQHADVAGLQEALRRQIVDLEKRLPDHAWIGVGRDDGKEGGEYSPIFYDKRRFEAIDSGTFWLSDTPDKVGSKGWDAALPRVCTWARLKDRPTGKVIFVANTHFDHQGEKARETSAKLLARQLPKLAGEFPLALTGDFNCTSSSAPYQALTKSDSKFADSRGVSLTPHLGPDSTWNGFSKIEPGRQIDFVFVGPGFKVRSHVVVDERVEGRFASDHLAVQATLEF